jgi:hypothetical protein
MFDPAVDDGKLTIYSFNLSIHFYITGKAAEMYVMSEISTTNTTTLVFDGK